MESEWSFMKSHEDYPGKLIEQAKVCITRRLNYHRAFPPISSARYIDMDSGIPFNEARECDCDFCLEDREWIVNYDHNYRGHKSIIQVPNGQD